MVSITNTNGGGYLDQGTHQRQYGNYYIITDGEFLLRIYRVDVDINRLPLNSNLASANHLSEYFPLARRALCNHELGLTIMFELPFRQLIFSFNVRGRLEPRVCPPQVGQTIPVRTDCSWAAPSTLSLTLAPYAC